MLQLKIKKNLSLLLLVFVVVTLVPAQAEAGDYRDLFGIVWRGTATDNLKYAKQMGYNFVGYRGGMESDPNAAGMKFYIDGPEFGAAPIWARITTTNTYTDADKQLYEKYFAWKSTQAFPNNLATGWFFDSSGTYFSVQPDWQQQAVIDYYVEKIITIAKSLENSAIGFTFGGFMWDVPDLTGDFWDKPQGNGGAQVTLAYWTGKDSSVLHPGITHEYATYSDGKAAFYKKLFARMRQEFPDAKTMMEPYTIYESWIQKIEGRSDKAELIPDMVMQEKAGTEFVDDSRIYSSGLVTRDNVGSTSPESFGEYENRLYAAKAAINGAWFGWFGRFGGTGDMPNYQNVYEVPPRLLLIRRIPAWDNLVGIPLSQRSWNGSVYSSPNSYADSNIIYSRHWKTKKIFVVFLNTSGVVTLTSGESVTSVQRTDSFFIESGDGIGDVNITGNTIGLKNSANLGKGYIITVSGGTPPSDAQTPFSGVPIALPGTIQAEDFDNGGEGVAYHDIEAANQGSQYRATEGVDIEVTGDAGGGYNVGWTNAGEWLEYTVNVSTSGTYTIKVRVASNGSGGTFHIEFNGDNKTGPMTIPNTGDWQNWQAITKTGVTLNAGQQVMRIVMDTNGASGNVGNFNHIAVTSAPSSDTTPPSVPKGLMVK